MILVTGATGFIGSSLVKKLVSQGHKVRCLARGKKSLKNLTGITIEFSQGDITNPESLKNAFENVDTVYHLVGIIQEKGEATFEKIHFEGTKNVVDISKQHRVKRYIQMSALGTRENALSRYHQTKWKVENYVKSSDLTYTIFRPSVVFGPADDFINKLGKLIKFLPAFPIFGDGTAKLQPVYVEDLTDCMLKALNMNEAENKFFELGGPQVFTYEELIRKIKTWGGWRRIIYHLPYSLVWSSIKIAEKVFPFFPVSTDQLIMLKEDNICDNTSLLSIFKIQMKSMDEIVPRYLKA